MGSDRQKLFSTRQTNKAYSMDNSGLRDYVRRILVVNFEQKGQGGYDQ